MLARIAIFASLMVVFSSFSFAGPEKIQTPSGEVVCGGTLNGEDLNFSRIPDTSILKATDQHDQKVLLFVDLSKRDRVRLAFHFGMSDDELAALSAFEARSASGVELEKLLRRIGLGWNMVMYVGFYDHIAHFNLETGDNVFSVSCQLRD